ncbi:hypothetical protein [Pseudarthrobacter sp. AB1]|uniref:hypothetical protein n=1 Tax=Pseudarthrobacter sp. AB1 TaxID=2138309 RepID=UPI00186B64A2|nr:hypothetical protein [Pseudarthrobacter sp. AB1]
MSVTAFPVPVGAVVDPAEIALPPTRPTKNPAAHALPVAVIGAAAILATSYWR